METKLLVRRLHVWNVVFSTNVVSDCTQGRHSAAAAQDNWFSRACRALGEVSRHQGGALLQGIANHSSLSPSGGRQGRHKHFHTYMFQRVLQWSIVQLAALFYISRARQFVKGLFTFVKSVIISICCSHKELLLALCIGQGLLVVVWLSCSRVFGWTAQVSTSRGHKSCISVTMIVGLTNSLAPYHSLYPGCGLIMTWNTSGHGNN